MLIPSISIVLVSFGIFAALMAANWLIWGATFTHDFRLPRPMAAAGGLNAQPTTGADADHGFKRVA